MHTAANLMVLFNKCLKVYIIGTAWGWFVVPLGVPTITYLHTFGLMLAVAVYRFPVKITEKSEEPLINEIAIACLHGSAFLVLWLVWKNMGAF